MIDFPDPENADETGLVAVGGDLEVETLISAYTKGIFPWPHPGYPLLWFSPKERGIIKFENLHISTSLKKFLKKTDYKITFNKAFAEVMEGCASVPRPGQNGTWVTREMKKAYLKFHQKGYAHSVECWDEKDLVGGLYGVWVGGAFVGESMFFKKDNASKMCLVSLIEFLRSQGHQWMDVQMVTSVVERLGGEYVSQKKFLKMWELTLKKLSFESLKFPSI
ncbi:MAG: leucyl/phenylalanyl-tRNA--protein transferase [Proteobacteria bacterium SG_bin7]|nr:MAG: leucyl/phenylalanyl-tRNA--protein transferase [Proteobacteria bacterium SG_bin7]